MKKSILTFLLLLFGFVAYSQFTYNNESEKTISDILFDTGKPFVLNENGKVIDTVDINVTVKSNPTKVVVQQDFTKGDSIVDRILSVQSKQIESIDQNMKTLISNLDRKEELLLKQQSLKYYNIDIKELAKKQRISDVILYSILYIILSLIYIVNSNFNFTLYKVLNLNNKYDIIRKFIFIICLSFSQYYFIKLISVILLKDQYLFDLLIQLF